MNFPETFQDLEPELGGKASRLFRMIDEMGSLVVAYSGGVDSSLLCAFGHRILGSRFLAVTVVSPVETDEDHQIAVELARQVGFQHKMVVFDDLQNPIFVANPPDRCYHCKFARFQAIKTIALDFGANWVAEGSNADDAFDYRPGARAVAELGIRSPLAEAGLTKTEIRELAKALGLPVWNRPSAPCLATRFPYGNQVTRRGLEQIARGEAYLRALGFKTVRVRHFGDTARIEVLPQKINDMVAVREKVLDIFQDIGFTYIVVDLAGYRSGSMNEVLRK